MIKKLNYHEIDFEKYNLCLTSACQNSDYARKDFLDIVAHKKWEILVLGDYDAVMPICFTKKLWFKIVLMPMLCQQLGVFSKTNDVIINDLFLDYFQKEYNIIFYAFNKSNLFSKSLVKKTSFKIEQCDYAEVKKKYSMHRRRNVRIIGDLEKNLEFNDQLTEAEEDFFYENAKGIYNRIDRERYYMLMKLLKDNNLGDILILRYNQDIQSLVFLYQSTNHSYLSLFVNKINLTNRNIPSIMIDYCLQNFISKKSFDFMGSDVNNVADFNSRFGAVAYKYSVITKSKLSLLKNILKK